MRKASSLVEAPNVDNTSDSETLKRYFKDVKEKKERNAIVCKAYKEGYSQTYDCKSIGFSTVYGECHCEKRDEMIRLRSTTP